MAQEVRDERNKFIGGSDIPVIMCISPFKKRFDLLLEKAGLIENDFEGNEYTEYGNVLEPQIRDYINQFENKPFIEDKKIVNDIRCHVDGSNQKDTILEIKTTSRIHQNLENYKVYLVQLLLYMDIFQFKKGKLAVYERPSDFNLTFDRTRLTIYDINIKDYKELLETIWDAIDQFRADLLKVKENPFITEEDLQPKEVIAISNQLEKLEVQLASYKKLEEYYDELKKELYQAMVNNNVKKWTTNNGTQITRVDGTEDKTIIERVIDIEKMKKDYIYEDYLMDKEIVKKGRAGYVRITTK